MPSSLLITPLKIRVHVLAGLLLATSSAFGGTLSVGPGKTFATPCAAFAVAVNGDIVEIDAAGIYRGDVCAIYPSGLTIRGVNGRPKIDAAGQNAMGKGTWVVEGAGTTIENVEMFGAKVADQNGAAIRLDGRDLTLRGSFLHHNENGILTSNDGVSDLVIENNEFSANGFGTGYTHNLYIGHVNSLVFRGNYSHDANVGHNLKSRAQTNTIVANRFSSTEGGQPSYEADFPNGGTTYFIGNIVQQPAANQNPGMLAYGEEGATNAKQDLYVVNNTFINDDSSRGTFVFAGTGVATPVLIQNNIFVGTGTIITQATASDKNNLRTLSPSFIDRAGFDLHPSPGSLAINTGGAAGNSPAGVSLVATIQYKHPASTEPRPVNVGIDIGAYAATIPVNVTPGSDSTTAASALTSPFNLLPSLGASSAAVAVPNAITQLPAPAPGTTPVLPSSFLGFKWNPCGAENTLCQIPGLSVVRYGANGQYNYQVAMSAQNCTNQNFGDPIVGIFKGCDYISFATMPTPPIAAVAAVPNPIAQTTWVTCAIESGVCNFTGTRNVRYGAQGAYSTLSATNSIACNNSVFGDPLWGVSKLCQYQVSISTPPLPQQATVTAQPTTITNPWTECAAENGLCSFSGIHQVRYGAQGTYAMLIGTNGIASNNTVFGDPLYGIAKTCAYLN